MRALLIILALCVQALMAFRHHSVGIRGKLFCGDKPLADTEVKLWDKRTGPDVELARVKTDSDGSYELQGGTDSVLGLDVHFKIYHDCDDGIKPCQRKVNLQIPSDYVTRTDKVTKWFNGGSMNMQFKFPDEERHCF